MFEQKRTKELEDRIKHDTKFLPFWSLFTFQFTYRLPNNKIFTNQENEIPNRKERLNKSHVKLQYLCQTMVNLISMFFKNIYTCLLYVTLSVHIAVNCFREALLVYMGLWNWFILIYTYVFVYPFVCMYLC